VTRLACPSCDEDCTMILPENGGYVDGQTGQCQCGVNLIVVVDGQEAFLVHDDEGNRDWYFRHLVR
jgi:hypothetical protein